MANRAFVISPGRFDLPRVIVHRGEDQQIVGAPAFASPPSTTSSSWPRSPRATPWHGHIRALVPGDARERQPRRPCPRRRNGQVFICRGIFRITYRSSGVLLPHIPWVIWWSSAQARHEAWAGQVRQIRFASSIWSSAGPASPIGKKISGSASRQAAWSRQLALTLTAHTRFSRLVAVDVGGAQRGCHAARPEGRLPAAGKGAAARYSTEEVEPETGQPAQVVRRRNRWPRAGAGCLAGRADAGDGRGAAFRGPCPL
jgi:hypothetical protein